MCRHYNSNRDTCPCVAPLAPLVSSTATILACELCSRLERQSTHTICAPRLLKCWSYRGADHSPTVHRMDPMAPLPGPPLKPRSATGPSGCPKSHTCRRACQYPSLVRRPAARRFVMVEAQPTMRTTPGPPLQPSTCRAPLTIRSTIRTHALGLGLQLPPPSLSSIVTAHADTAKFSCSDVCVAPPLTASCYAALWAGMPQRMPQVDAARAAATGLQADRSWVTVHRPHRPRQRAYCSPGTVCRTDNEQLRSSNATIP